jgi:hypothetical protein
MADFNLTKRVWGLWSHFSWRELAFTSGVITAAFLAYCANNTRQGGVFSNMSYDAATLYAGFFIPYTVINYSSIQQSNQIKKKNLSTFMLIGEQLTSLEKQYYSETKPYPIVETLVLTIKNAARSCLSLQLVTNKPNNHISNLLVINQLMGAINQNLKHFISKLPEYLDPLDETFFEEEIKFWEQDPLTLKEHLLPTQILENDFIKSTLN